MAQKKTREKEFARWPKYKDSYIRAFEKMLSIRNKPFVIGGADIPDAKPIDVFNWWMEYDILPGQLNLFEDYEEDEDE